jgi:ABC-type glycerol-3-phosphate transport system permease component
MEWTYLMAAALLSTLPVLLMFLLGQRFFIAGLTSGAVKG